MKKIFSFFAVFLLVLFSAFEFSSCVVEEDSSSSVRVALPGNSRGAFVFNEEAASYFALNLKGFGINRSEIGYAGTIVSFDNIPAGNYDLDVAVFADNHIAFASGSRKVRVQANSSELVEITAHMLYGMKLGSSILDSNYYLFEYSSSEYEYKIPRPEDFAASISPSSRLTDPISATSFPIFTVAKDSFYYSTDGFSCSRSDDISVSISEGSEIFDVYYEDVNDRVWCFGKAEEAITYFALTSQEFNPTPAGYCSGYGILPDSLDKLYCIAAKGDRVYVAYKNSNLGLMIQTYIAEEGGNLKKTGNAVHVSVPGISTLSHIEITDMQVMYDGNLYVLVRDYSHDGFTHSYKFDHINEDTGEHSAYSRGAIIKYSTVGNVLNMEKILGWTKNPKVMVLPSGLIPGGSTGDICKKLNAYIPEVGDFSNSFLGPMRFIAVKPKELVVADFGVNYWLADEKKKINGGKKFHSRAVSVDLASFAITDICEFINFNFDIASADASEPIFSLPDLDPEYTSAGEY